MKSLYNLMQAKEALIIGLMSGTSADGIDAALVRITGSGRETKLISEGFISVPYSAEMRQRLLNVAAGDFGGSRELCLLHFRLGELFARACLDLCEAVHISPEQVDFVGSHGHTVYHAPLACAYLGAPARGTLQIGEPSVIAEALNTICVSDFRVRDFAAEGYGAPLVPYTEYLLYADSKRDVALQNIGGIGNLTLIPAGASLEEVCAFDTGPGNMVMDAVCERITKGKMRYDESGKIAAAGKVSAELLRYMEDDSYLKLAPPKTTGREKYGRDYVDRLFEKAKSLGLEDNDILASATMFTARCITIGLHLVRPHADEHNRLRLIAGGGGASNPTLLKMIAQCLPECDVLTNEDIGRNSDAKEAEAFALLANETIHEHCNNAISATGATHPVVMGKISF